MLVLVGVPLVVFVIPALFGVPAMSGDNIIQNFPLRVYTGDLLRHGHLPLWNPYIWSGSPLLAALNAGSAYPGTWLFVVLPPFVAWVANLLAVYWAAGLGCYALLRYYRLEPLPSFLGAAVYAFSGAMVGQMVHLGIIQGMGWMPWVVLAELGLGRAVLRNPRVPGSEGVDRTGLLEPVDRGGLLDRVDRWSVSAWTVALTVGLALILLTGEPRSIAEAEIVAAVLGVWILFRPYGGPGGGGPGLARRAWLAVLLAATVVWATAISAAQLLPGWSFISGSQRASESLSFFGSGSLPMRWSALLLVPDLFGGDGFLHQPSYFNGYNLPEVTGYVGLLPLAAGLALLTRSFGRRRDPRSSDWGVWLVLAVLGMLLAWGTYTPLGTVFEHIPLFGKTRLQSRNLGIVDLSLAILFAFWLQRVWGVGGVAAGLRGWRRWVTVTPLLATAALCVVALAIPARLEGVFGVPASAVGLGRYLTPWFVASLVLALGGAALVLGWRRLDAKGHRVAVCAFVFVDLLVFTASSSTGLSPGYSHLVPNTATAQRVLGDRGRTAFVESYPDADVLSEIGEPDLNVFTEIPSVQGYGSLVTGTYGDATGTHYLETMDACALARGVFRPLRLATLLTNSSQLLVRVPADGSAPFANPSCSGAPPAGRPGVRTWYFGDPEVVTAAYLRPNGKAAAAALARTAPGVALLTAGGTVVHPPVHLSPLSGGGWSVVFDHPTSAVGMVVTGPAQMVSNKSEITVTGGQQYRLDGPLQSALGQTGWRYTGLWKGFARFEARTVAPPVWIQGGSGTATVQQVSTPESGTEVDRVDASQSVLVVRSEAASPGWSVTAVPVGGGKARVLPVETVGLVQGVRVPAGRWTLTFDYWPPRFTAGLILSGLGVGALLVALVVWMVGRRRRGGRRASIERT